MEQEKLSLIELEQRYNRGAVHRAKVQLLRSFGAIVVLSDGTKGIIRNRELSWDNEIEHSGEALSLGQYVEVMVLGVEPQQQRLNLSLRQARRDPWKEIGLRYRPEQVILGKVVRLRESGAIIELEPAIESFVSLSEICSSPPEKIDDILWVGDWVEAIITRIDEEERRVELSIRKHLSNLQRQQEAVASRVYLQSHQPGLSLLGEAIKPEQLRTLLHLYTEQKKDSKDDSVTSNSHDALVEQFPRILIADDYASFRDSLRRLLIRLGHQVEVAESAEKAVSLCAEKDFSLVLMDLEFRTGHQDGLEATRQLLAMNPSLPIIIVTATSRFRGHPHLVEEIQAMGIRGLLMKPVDLSSLDHAMTAIITGQDQEKPESLANPVTSVNLSSEVPHHLPLSQGDMGNWLRRELADLQRLTEAQACVLFHMSPTREVRVFANIGTPLTRYDESKYNLQATPIDEVIRHGVQVYDPDISGNPRKYQYLNILNFSSCIGVPVRSFDRTEYGLFLFHAQKGHFKEEHLRLATSSSAMLGAIIARKETERIFQRAQPLILEAQLSSQVIHELGNRLGGMLSNVATLAHDQKEIIAEPEKIIDPRFRNEMGVCLQDIEKDGQAMSNIIHLYLGLARTETQGSVNVNEVIQRVIRLLQPTAEEHQVRIVDKLEEGLPITFGVEVRLEQVFVNIALNAIQHMSPSHQDGKLVIQTEFARRNSHFPLQIRFTDTGPGIHGQLFERVFELGFSTLSEGTGLGLFITRGLIESMGGKITVEKSTMFIGTTFLVELPLVVPSFQGAAS